MLNPFKLLAIYGDLNKIEAITKEKGKMTALKISQIAAILVGLAGAVNAATVAQGFVHQHVVLCTVLYGVAQILHAVLPSIFAAPVKQPSGVVKAAAMVAVLGLFTMLPAPVRAQAATTTTATASTSNGFASSAGPVAVHYNGTWSAASFERESYDLYDFGATKSNHVYIQGLELEMPTPAVNLYMGGVVIQPDLSALLKKTNLPAGSFGVYFDGNVGNGVPATGNSAISWLAGGGVLYKLNGALTWQPLTVQYGRFGGNGFAAMSTQLQVIFGK